jgi:uncharacterized SAM-binding protein YcdF (DUF218 family)
MQPTFHPPEKNSTWVIIGSGLAAGLVFVFVLTFILFAEGRRDAAMTPATQQTADGVVILTGKSDERIKSGLSLLAAGKVKRALVSGVHETLNMNDVLGFATFDAELISCCVDLDYRATNTVGNAGEAAMWAEIHGYRSIILVTSTHHMPRSLIEMRRVMPHIRFIAHPVNPPGVQLQSWWRYPGTLWLLLGEYTRYLFALFDLTGNHEPI